MGYRQLLRENRDFRYLWFGQLVSEVGDWFNNIVLLAIVTELTGSSAFAISIYIISRHLPLFVFGPIAGVLSDRLSRRGIMIAADLIRAALALSFIFIRESKDLWILYVSSSALAMLSILFLAAKRASIPNIAPGKDLLNANALSNSTNGLTLALGSGLGGIVAIQFGRTPVFVLNSVSFLFSLVMILMVRIPQPGKGTASLPGNFLTSSWREFREGISYIKSVPIVLAIMWLTAGWSFGNGSARVVYPLFGAAFADAMHKADDFGISILYVAMGTGSVIGTIVVARFLRLERIDLTKTIAIAVIWDGLCLTLFSFMRSLWLGAFLLMCRDIGFAIWRSAQQTELMRETDDAMRGRVFATYETISALLMMSTMVLAPPAINRIGYPMVTTVAGTLIIATGVLWFSKVVLSRGQLSKQPRPGQSET